VSRLRACSGEPPGAPASDNGANGMQNRGSDDEEQGQYGHVAGADIRSDQQDTTVCRQPPPRRGGMDAPRQDAANQQVERHTASQSNNGSMSANRSFRVDRAVTASGPAAMSP
jgi:hypothetical protein